MKRRIRIILLSTLLLLAIVAGLLWIFRIPLLAFAKQQFGTDRVAAALTTLPPAVRSQVLPSFTIDFRTQAHGFGFENYGASFPEGDLTIAEVHAMFGDQVCTHMEGNTCIPTAEAEFWIDEMNSMMQGGHCVGFTAMSYLLYRNQVAPSSFTSAANSTYEIPQVVPIMRNIAQSYALSYSPTVYKQTVHGTPSFIIDQLRLLGQPVDVGVLTRDHSEGHSLLAYGVQDKGNGIFWIQVYDNNWPGRDLYVEVNYPADTWRYSLAATNPNQDATAWEGDAQTNTLFYVPLAAYEQKPECPFCKTATTADSPKRGTTEVSLISLSGTSNLLVTSPQGQEGRTNGDYVDTIPGATLLPALGGRFSKESPYLIIPPAGELTVTATGSQADELANLQVVNPAFSVDADELHLQPNTQEQLIVSPDTQQFRYVASATQHPVFRFITHQGAVEYNFSLSDIPFQVGQGVSIRIDPTTNTVHVTSAGATAPHAVLMITRLDPTGQAVFMTSDLALTAGGTVALDIAQWDGAGSLPVRSDTASDGTFEQTLSLPQGFPNGFIAGAALDVEMVDRLKAIAPYLDTVHEDALLQALSTLPLRGDDFAAMIFLLYEENHVSDAQITTFIKQVPMFREGSTFAPSDLAAFLFDIHEDAAHLTTLIESLGLSPSGKQQVRAELDAFHEVQATLVAWDEANQDAIPTTLVAFLKERHLNAVQLGHVLKALNLPADEVAIVLNQLSLTNSDQQTVVADTNSIQIGKP